MARKKPKAIEGFVMFDVIYEDGSKSSRRRVSAADIAEHGDAYAKTAIMDQDHKLTEVSGHKRGPIVSFTRSAN